MREPTAKRVVLDGIQHIYRFANGYGASVIRHKFSKGYSDNLWELAVIRFDGPDIWDWSLDYETPIAEDVIGDRTDVEIDMLLKEIMGLPPNKKIIPIKTKQL